MFMEQPPMTSGGRRVVLIQRLILLEPLPGKKLPGGLQAGRREKTNAGTLITP
jgi:hypothetical protein